MINRFVVALVIFVVWILITALGPKVQIGGQDIQLGDLVSRAIAIWFVVAVAFLLIAVAILGWWRQVGLRKVEPTKSWTLTWFPFLLILIFLSASTLMGLPPSGLIFFVLINTLLVGISEELMTRGVLFYGALSQFGIWTTIIIVSVLFGGMHLMNGFITGEFQAAAVQATAAGMSGVLFIALRMRTNSLLPGIVVHWFWDFSLFVMQAALAGSVATAANQIAEKPTASLAQQIVLPLAMATPSFLYGLWLLRHIGRRDKAEFIDAN